MAEKKAVEEEIVRVEKIAWAIGIFNPYKSVGRDDI